MDAQYARLTIKQSVAFACALTQLSDVVERDGDKMVLSVSESHLKAMRDAAGLDKVLVARVEKAEFEYDDQPSMPTKVAVSVQFVDPLNPPQD